VFVLEGDVARQRPVKVLRRSAAEAMIESGVEPGATIVVYPSDVLSDGARVTRRAARN
jgi:HlyD family secretion protein